MTHKQCESNIYEKNIGLKCQRPGTLSLSDGSVYEGLFAEGLKEGEGVLVDKDGVRYEGPFHKDAKDGSFTVTPADGSASRTVIYAKDREKR